MMVLLVTNVDNHWVLPPGDASRYRVIAEITHQALPSVVIAVITHQALPSVVIAEITHQALPSVVIAEITHQELPSVVIAEITHQELLWVAIDCNRWELGLSPQFSEPLVATDPKYYCARAVRKTDIG